MSFSRSRRPLSIALALSLLVGGCQAPGALSIAPAAKAAAAWQGPQGEIQLSVRLTSGRRVQWVPTQQATHVVVEVTGAGLDGWQTLPIGQADPRVPFGPADEHGSRVATLTAKVPAGDRRIFRVTLYDGHTDTDVVLDELWGAGDVPAGKTTPAGIQISPMTTPVGKIFRELILLHPAKALTLPIASVQHYVEQLANTNAATGERLRTGAPQVHPALLAIPAITTPIVRGNAGMTFQIPNPIPAELLMPDPADPQNPAKRALDPAAKKRAVAHVKVIDFQGRVLKRPYVFYMTDPATTEQLSSAEVSAEATLDAAAGDWTLFGNDLTTGLSARKAIRLSEGPTNEIYLVAAPQAERLLGSYDRDRDQTDSFNGEQTPAELAYMSSPGAMAVQGGVLRYIDAGNHRLRQLRLDDPLHLVTTFAGNGQGGHFGDGGPAMQARLALGNAPDLVVDRNGVTYVAQTDGKVRAIAPDGTIRTIWSNRSYPFWDLTDLAYDAARHHLYMGFQAYGNLYRVDLAAYDPDVPTTDDNATRLAANGIVKVDIPYAGDPGPGALAIVGDHLFTATRTGKIHRRHLVSGQQDQLVGKAPQGPAGDDMHPWQLSESGLNSMAGDARGNLFFFGSAGLYRLMNATSGTESANDWRVKLILPDGDAYLKHVAVDPDTDRVYVMTRQLFKNNANQDRWVPVIQELRP